MKTVINMAGNVQDIRNHFM